MRFTDTSIAGLKAKSERHEKWEDGRTGLGVRVTPRGVKTFVFMYRFEGKARRLTLGQYGRAAGAGISLSTARRMLGAAREKLDQGIDPGVEVVEQRREERQAESVDDLIDLYLEKWAKPRKRSAGEDERILRKDVSPRWGRLKAGSIRKGDVVALLDDIVNRGAPLQANRTLACIRKMFNFAIARDISGMGINPCHGVAMPSPENQRDRQLSRQEVVTFWRGLDNDNVDMSERLRICLKLQLATAQRKGELVAATWPEMDLDAALWTIPAAKAKNRVEHLVPLSDLAIGLLKDLKALGTDKIDGDNTAADSDVAQEEWLFPSPRGGKSITPESVNHAMRRNLIHIGVENLTPHDLRRTAASIIGSEKVPRFIISRVLNHVDRSVTGRYDRHEYLDEKREALDKLGAHIETLLAADDAGNVTVFPAQAGE